MSLLIYKIKRSVEKFITKVKRPFIRLSDKFKEFKEKSSTRKVIVNFSNTGERVIYNFKDNSKSWKNRTLDDHGFMINEEDS